MGIDVNRLKEKIAETGVNIEAFAKSVEMDKTTFYRKLNAGGVKFTICEIQRIIKKLGLSNEEAMSIFFTEEVA